MLFCAGGDKVMKMASFLQDIYNPSVCRCRRKGGICDGLPGKKVNEAYNDNTVDVFGGNPRYHFSLILYTEGDDEYWQSFKEGVSSRSRKKSHNAAIEFNPVSGPTVKTG